MHDLYIAEIYRYRGTFLRLYSFTFKQQAPEHAIYIINICSVNSELKVNCGRSRSLKVIKIVTNRQPLLESNSSKLSRFSHCL